MAAVWKVENWGRGALGDKAVPDVSPVFTGSSALVLLTRPSASVPPHPAVSLHRLSLFLRWRHQRTPVTPAASPA